MFGLFCWQASLSARASAWRNLSYTGSGDSLSTLDLSSAVLLGRSSARLVQNAGQMSWKLSVDIQQGESTEQSAQEGKIYTGCREVAWTHKPEFFAGT